MPITFIAGFIVGVGIYFYVKEPGDATDISRL